LAYERGSALELRLSYDSAKAFYAKAVELDSGNIDYQISYAKSVKQAGDPRMEYSILKKAEPLAINTGKEKLGRFFIDLGDLCQDLGETDNALEYLSRAIGIDTVVFGKNSSGRY